MAAMIPAASKSYPRLPHSVPTMKAVDEERLTKKARLGKMDMFTIIKKVLYLMLSKYLNWNNGITLEAAVEWEQGPGSGGSEEGK